MAEIYDCHLEAADALRRCLHEAIAQRTCWVALLHGEIAGYVILRHTFFGEGQIVLLGVHPGLRRRGIGTALAAHAEDRCPTRTIFACLPHRDEPMRRLVRKCGFRRSGIRDQSFDPQRVVVYTKEVAGAVEADPGLVS
jgi:ribosomal protein S18 acetylase RimI-like enzyme